MRLARILEGQKILLAVQMDAGLFDISEIRNIRTTNIPDYLSNINNRLDDLYCDITAAMAQNFISPIDPPSVKFLIPVEQPGKIICLGLNYTAHAKEGGFPPPGTFHSFSRFQIWPASSTHPRFH